MKLLLLLLLISTPVNADGHHVSAEACRDINEILSESVEQGYIKEQEAELIYKRCLATSK